MTHPITDALSETDLKLAQPSMTVKLSTLAQGLTGVLVALCGLQVVHLEFRIAAIDLVPVFMMSAGMLHLVLAVQVYRARPWAALASAVLGPTLAVLMLSWTVFSLSAAIFSCLLPMATALAVVSALLTLLAVGPVKKTAAARQRMAEQGMSLGF